jgi:uncharacterized protein (TIRG00374 family)
MTKNRGSVFVLKLAISLGLVAYALSRADLATALRLFPDLRLLPLFAMLSANLASRLLSAYRWYRLVKPVQPAIDYLPFVRITLGSSFYGQFLPGGGVETLQIAGLARTRSSTSVAVASVFADRIFGILSLALLMTAGFGLSRSKDPAGIILLGIVLAVVSSLLIAIVSNNKYRARLLNALPSRVGNFVENALGEALSYFDIFRHRPRLIAETLALAIAMQLLRVIMFWLGAFALGAQLPVSMFLLSVPVILLLLILPISIGGIGVREGTLVFFFSIYGLNSELALALALLVYLSNIVVAVPGAWFGLQGLRQVH